MQVSIARSGAQCSALPAVVLALTHNFTAAQRMQGAAPPAPGALEAHAKDTKEHFELARSLFKKVPSCHAPNPLCALSQASPRNHSFKHFNPWLIAYLRLFYPFYWLSRSFQRSCGMIMVTV